MNLVLALADLFGCSSDGLKLILGLIAGYPALLIYNKFVCGYKPIIQHIYLSLCGISVAFLIFGFEGIFHSIVCILFTYFALLFLGGNVVSLGICFVWNMGYLFLGYWNSDVDGYDVSWTMPHCVLTLRLIGFAFDIYDGNQPKEMLSKERNDGCLRSMPTLLELISLCFFNGSYLVGPQFSMKKFQNFVERNAQSQNDTEFERKDENFSQIQRGFLRGFLGIIYIAIHLVGSTTIPESYIKTKEFQSMSFLTQQFWFIIWVKVVLSKYIGAWLLAEGSCIISGIAHNGVAKNGSLLWNGSANVKVGLYECSIVFGDLIESFNINTNAWVLVYIYKRLRFLGNKYLSQIFTLLFLAFWHGTRPGYYMTFFNEFIVIVMEKKYSSLIGQSKQAQDWLKFGPFRWFCLVIGKCYILLMMPHCFMPFSTLDLYSTVDVLKATWGIHYVIVFVQFLFYPLFERFLLDKQQGGQKKD